MKNFSRICKSLLASALLSSGPAFAALNLQFSTELRTAQAQAIATVAGTSPILRVYNGTMPANCAASITGTLLAQGTLPSTPFATASSGAISKTGTWTLTGQSGASASAGTHFRLWKSDGTTCVLQGTWGVGTYDMQPDVNSITNGQTVTISTFTITRGNQ